MESGRPASSTTTVWLVLLVASAASLWLGSDATDRSHTAAAVGVLTIGFAKIWLIVRYFMEVRFAPLWLRLSLDAWVAGVFVAITALYLTFAVG